MIQVQQVSRYFGALKAVDDVSFQVEKGEILGFLGPNAAGKTTTMRILTTFLPATSGTATIAGYDVMEDPMEVRKRIGYLPENPPLYQEMKVDDFLNFVATIKGVEPGDRKRAVSDALEKTDTTDVAGRVIKTLSKGYKQRVGLAQALVHNPPVLILDEPTVGLDPKQIIEVRELIKTLAGDHTVILSTHILPEVSMTCERVVIINKGTVVAEDTPTNLTRTLTGGQRVRLAVSGPEEAVREKLSQLDLIQTVELVEKGNESSPTLFSLTSDSEDEITPAVATVVVNNGWNLFELSSESVSLEDVFLHVTTKEEGTVQ